MGTVAKQTSPPCLGSTTHCLRTFDHRCLLLAILGAVFILALAIHPPVAQDPDYHLFADRRTIWGIGNGWNVLSNLSFVFAFLAGVRRLRSLSPWLSPWQRLANWILLGAVLLVACGSALYHLHPADDTLVWDRLPMTIAFMTLFAIVVENRVSSKGGRFLLPLFLVAGVASIVCWQLTGDLRPYALVQFYPLLAIPAILLLYPSRVNLWPVLAWYGLAKVLELLDPQIALVIATGGHPWKHVAAAIALYSWVRTLRKPCSSVPPALPLKPDPDAPAPRLH